MKSIALFVACCFLGCSVQPSGERRQPFAFDLERAGKADGQSVLPADDLTRIGEAFQVAIAKAEAEIARLEVEIRKLEDGNRRKQSEIDSLVSQIASRKAEVERNRNLALLSAGVFGIFTFGVGAIAGAAALGSLAVAYANDSRLQTLERSLSQARSDQAAMRAQADRYAAQKKTIAAQLAVIRQSKAKLLAALESPDPIEPIEALRMHPEAASGYRRVKLLEAIFGHATSEIDALTQLRNAAQALSDALDQTLATLRALAADADRLAKESREEFLKILEAALSGDPLAVATAWLSNVLADRTREMLAALDWPIADFVAHLIRTRFTGSEDDVLRLTTTLLEKLAGRAVEEATAWQWSGSDAMSRPLEDFDLIDSTLRVERSGTVKRARATIEIRHSFPGDLYIWLIHGDKDQVLHAYEGGATADVKKTYELEALVGSDASGVWELLVADDYQSNAGTFISWKLELEGAL